MTALQRPRTPLILLQFALLIQLLLVSTFALADGNDNASNTAESIFNSAKGQGLKVGGSILAVVAMAAGAVVLVAGYKLFRPALFVVGFAIGGVLIAIAAEKIFENKSWVVTASWIAFIIGGIIVGALVITFYKVSIFVAGAAAGVMLAMIINTSFGYKIWPSHPNTILIILAVILAIVGGVLALKLEKPLLIVATSLLGAGMVVWGVGYFAGDFPNAGDLKRFATQDGNGDWNYSIPTAWWGYLAGIVVLFVLGMFIQFRKTGKGVKYHQ
ncbi:hypothetical protein Gpo141_00014822, partial [Globisporangium polare]